MNEISITFWEKDGENEIFGSSAPFYPNYRIGDKIFLQRDCHEFVPEKFKTDSIPLREYKIVDIHHSVRQNISDKPTIDKIDDEQFSIPFSIHSYFSVEVYVEKVI